MLVKRGSENSHLLRRTCVHAYFYAWINNVNINLSATYFLNPNQRY